MSLPEWLNDLPVCPECGLHYYQANGFRLHIVVIVDANGCIRLSYRVACEMVGDYEEQLAQIY